MNEIDFLRGIETPAQSTDDLLAGSEHLVRLKQQSGQSSQTQYPDLELEKTAGWEDHATKAVEFGMKHRKAVIGAGVGALGVNLAQQAKKPSMLGDNPLSGKGESKHPYLRATGERSLGLAAGAGIGHLLTKKAGEFTESLNTPKPSKMCATCHKEKDACMCGTKTAALEAAKSALSSGLKKNPALRAAAIGGLASGIPNAAVGAATAPPGHRAEGAARNGLIGAATGASGGALVHHLSAKLAFDQTWHRAMLGATTGAGALAGGIGTYLASRPQADTGKGKAEEELEGIVAANKSKPERGLLEKMKNRETETAHGFAKAFREHPKKAALIGLLTGALAGHGIGQLGGAIARRGGK